MHSKEIKQAYDQERKLRKLSYTENRCHARKLNKTDIELWRKIKETSCT
jgi:hypothetical protein